LSASRFTSLTIQAVSQKQFSERMLEARHAVRVVFVWRRGAHRVTLRVWLLGLPDVSEIHLA